MLRPRPKLISLCLLSVLLLAACGGTASPTAAGATIAPTTQATGRPATAPVGGTATRSGTTTATRTSTAGSTPTAALDLRRQQAVLVIARELASGGAAVLHDLNLAAYADRVVLLSASRLAAIEWPWVATVQDLAG